MENKYFDFCQFQKLQELRNFDLNETAQGYKQYLKDYPNDYGAYGYYASILITMGKFDEAEKVINYVEKKANQDKSFVNKETHKMKAVRFSVFYNRIKVYSYKGDYQKAYNLCLSHPNEIKHLNMNDFMFYCKQKLGMIDSKRRDKNSYLFRQIVEYREEDFLEHIKKHLADYNCDLDNPNKNVFSPNFPLDDVLKEVKKHMPSSKKLCAGFWENTYIFRCDECGKVDNRLVNYFKVVCFDKTSNIITMLPITECEKLPHIDLSYMMPKEKKEIKRESAMEKFNRKYRKG